MEKKVCSRCDVKKSYSEFYSQQKFTDERGNYTYFFPYCKKCTKRAVGKWRKENPDRAREIANRQNASPYRILYNRQNAERRRKNGKLREWVLNNPDKIKKYSYNRMNKNHDISDYEWDSCKKYFEYNCAYCGLSINDHYILFNGETRLGDFHREHVDHSGANDLSNCVPACKPCNSQKWEFKFEEWYNVNNYRYTQKRFDKIIKWLNEDYKLYIGKQ